MVPIRRWPPAKDLSYRQRGSKRFATVWIERKCEKIKQARERKYKSASELLYPQYRDKKASLFLSLIVSETLASEKIRRRFVEISRIPLSNISQQPNRRLSFRGR